ncbi:MAG: hypothetical protein KF869_01115 [Phycisphaeraceae bacterium]|nr:hypothetical protein [Phycisphaeraceae bacterium]
MLTLSSLVVVAAVALAVSAGFSAAAGLTDASDAAAEPPAEAAWRPVPGKIMTRWAKDVDPANPWPEYPRPLLQRERWMNLNGLWSYAITAKGAPMPALGEGMILVPYPVESALSGVGRALKPDQALHYRRGFTLPDDWKDGQILLHFGAVDWACTVSVNGHKVGEHTGGFDPFSFDITEALEKAPGARNEIVVTVTDPTDTGGQPRGKQWLTPHGIWYTPTSGIWQTVWLEPVPVASFSGLRIRTDRRSQTVEITPETIWWKSGLRHPWSVEVMADGKVVGTARADKPGTVQVRIPGPRLWTPDDPFLYEVRATIGDRGTLDSVTSYFAFRDVDVAADQHGVNRIRLNGEPLFQFGPLDQGFWPDGLYTPPTEEAMIFDILAAKKMGSNMLRKHVKVESQRFYHACDKLGILVWQDIPSPFFWDGKSDNPHGNPPLTDEWKQNFEREMRAIIRAFDQHPSIVMWVPFNEGWGQNDLAWSKSMVDLCKRIDPLRLINNASGWTDMGNGDVNDIHAYPGPATPTPQLPRDANRAMVLGEFGGLGLPIEGHTWLDKNNWGYKSYTDKDSLTAAYIDIINQLPIHIARGLAAAVYTQTTDVEIEVNGWLTYDREVWKIDPERAAAAANALYGPVPRIETVVPDAQTAPQSWRYTFEKPADGWEQPGFDAAAWKEGRAGFGTRGTPGAIVGTEWGTSAIWLRRTIRLDAHPINPAWSIHHDEDCEVYINGVLALRRTGYTTGYISLPLGNDAAELLRIGENTIAVHCRQTRGGQYIDVGIVDVKPGK